MTAAGRRADAAAPPRFPLPPYAHVPGVTPRHADGLFAAVTATTPAVTDTAGAATNPAWQHGLALLAAGFAWECHEVLEPVWRHAAPNGPERLVVRAVIQIANAVLKRRMGRPRAVARLCAEARALLAEAGRRADRPMGLDSAALSARLERWEQAGIPGTVPTVSDPTMTDGGVPPED